MQQRTRIVLVDKAEVYLAMKVLSLTYVLSLVRRDLQLLLPLCKWWLRGPASACVQFSTFVVNPCPRARQRERGLAPPPPPRGPRHGPRPCATRWGCCWGMQVVVVEKL